jgi:hypothetical protein
MNASGSPSMTRRSGWPSPMLAPARWAGSSRSTARSASWWAVPRATCTAVPEDEPVRTVAVLGTVDLDPSGVAVRTVGTVQDITDQRLLERLVIKGLDDRYQPGRRGWLKLRTRSSAEAIVGAITVSTHTTRLRSGCRIRSAAAGQRARW